ncbi:hypothetical protein Y032_0555g3372 [Ancylostoma ceylanicum]|uniref:Reverse transcriptase domain-containing protein n=1 Tax=Ancylostoma ceylanicum TaxID=53326 RepID=A0A016WQC9_9BILA|nr:hypothetical protein Y032_0555g3372 [Ancylostoma ceylanicum]
MAMNGRSEVNSPRKETSPSHFLLEIKTADNWRKYREARRTAKKTVAMAKATHYGKSNKDLDTRDGERLIYRLAKSSRRQAEDVKKFREINEEHGKLLVYYRKVRERLYECFEKVSIVEFTHLSIPQLPPTHGPVHSTTAQKREAALIQMKSGKAAGPDDIAVELWKSG